MRVHYVSDNHGGQRWLSPTVRQDLPKVITSDLIRYSPQAFLGGGGDQSLLLLCK